MDYEYTVLENPRRRRRSRRSRRSNPARPRRRRSRSRRRVAANPFPFTRRRRRRRSHRRNPFRAFRRRRNPAFFGLDLRSEAKAVGALVGGEFLGDLGARALNKFGLGKILTEQLKLTPDQATAGSRIAVGILGAPLLKMARLPDSFVRVFRTINIASGIIGLTYGMRQKALASVGLSGYEMGDYEGGGEWQIPQVPSAGLLGDPAGLLGEYQTDLIDGDALGSGMSITG